MKENLGRRRISDSAVDNPNFAAYTKKFFDASLTVQPDAGPMQKLKMLTDSMHKASNKIFRERKHEIDKVVLFQRAVALLRHLPSSDPDDPTSIRLIKGTPLRLLFLSRGSDDFIWNTSKLRAYINNAFMVDGVPDCNEEFVYGLDCLPEVFKPFAVPTVSKRTNSLKELQLKLPSTRSKIVALRAGPSNDPSSDLDVIGPLIQAFYGRIWRADGVRPGLQNELHLYLEEYKRRIDPTEIVEISLV